MKMRSVFPVLAVILTIGIGFVGCEQGAPTAADDIATSGDLDITSLAKGTASTSYDANAGTGTWAGFNESTDNPTYGSYSFGLWAGKTGDAGTVTITNDNSFLYVTYTTNGSADLGEVHVYVWSSTSQIPDKRPAPGQTPWKAENINANSYTMAIPVDVACGSTFYVSAHAALVNDGDGGDNTNAGETAYAGSNPFVNGKGAWWGFVTYTVDCFYDIDVNVSFEGDCSGDVTVVLEGSTLAPVNTNGTWSFNNIPAGIYTVTVTTNADVVNNTLSKQVTIGPDASESFTFVCVTTPPPPTGQNFPTWGQDISHIILVFTGESWPGNFVEPLGGGDVNDDLGSQPVSRNFNALDGYYTIKVDSWDGGRDLDAEIAQLLAKLEALGWLDSGYDLLGSSIKGGLQITSFYAYGSHNVNGESADVPPSGLGFTYNGTKDNETPQNAVDRSIDRSTLLQ